MTHYFGIIAAAGTGTRFGGNKPKQYEKIDGKTMLEKSIQALLDCAPIKKIIVVLHADDHYWAALPFAHHPKINTVLGAAERSGSVQHALSALTNIASPEDFILVHDAARPFISTEDILNLMEKTQHHEVGGILATPAVDTMKYSTDGKNIEKTVPRQYLFRALTPQCFRYEKLCHALAKAPNATDEAMALELAGFQPLLVLGDPKNKKITFRADL